jgi:hypothetical protein
MSGRQESRPCQICEQHSGAFRQTREHLLKNLRVLAGQVTRTAIRREREGEGEGGCHFRVSPGGRDGGREERESE